MAFVAWHIFLPTLQLQSQHTLIHSGVKDYECKQCGKKFASKSYLTIHTLIHSGVKDYECKQCGKRFTLKSYLNSHILTRSYVKD